MQKLYIKIVVAIWIVMILSAIAAIAALRAGPNSTQRQSFFTAKPAEMLAEVIEMGSLQTAAEGEAAFIDWMRNNPIFGKRFPTTVTRSDGEVVYQSGVGKRSAMWPAPAGPFEPIRVSRPEGEYQIRIMPPAVDRLGIVSPVQRSIVRAAFQPQLLWWLLLVAIPLSVILSVLVARYLVSPLRVFERAGCQLASGDLHVRVSPELGHRGDEIAEFASTFDHMAAKIEGLVRAHQRLLRDVSHELRTPLARVLAAASLARNAAPDTAAPDFDRIEQEVERLDSMISRLLRYTQLDANEACLKRAVVQLDQLLEDVVEDCRIEADAEARHIKLESTEPCTVIGDAHLLRSCMENVVRNGLRFTPECSAVEIRLRKNGVESVVTIRDYGSGVAEGDLPHLFKPFYQTDCARAPQFSGYGIGLAIAHKAIELHGGRIGAENVDEGGFIVRIVLPLAS